MSGTFLSTGAQRYLRQTLICLCGAYTWLYEHSGPYGIHVIETITISEIYELSSTGTYILPNRPPDQPGYHTDSCS